MQIARRVCYGFMTLAAAFVNVAPTSEVMAAPIMQTQEPCVAAPARHCIRFTAQNAGSASHTMRSIVFRPPRAGKAWVQFHGTGSCEADGPGSSARVYFDTQIVSAKTASPTATGAGGNTFYFAVDSTHGNAPHAFNLSSNRVFPITSTAAQTYHFNLSFTRIDSAISCTFYNLSFSVLFTPN